VELRTESPLMDVTIFRNRSFRIDNLVLFLAMIVFVPIFFFASEYGQVALGQTPAKASLMLLYFFTGFVVAAQIGGRMLDRIGARRPIFIGATLAAIGLHLWATHVTLLSSGTLIPFIVLAGAGMGLLLGQANTDALNHAAANAYGEATGITQTVRNFGSSLGLAVLGSVLVTQLRAHLAHTLAAQGLNAPQAHATAAKIAQFGGASDPTMVIPQFVRADFAQATASVLMAMSWVMVAAAIIGFLALPRHQRHAPECREALAEPNLALDLAGSR
jgi:MFS family permease